MAPSPARFSVQNAGNTPHEPNTDKGGNVYEGIAKWRRQQTLTPAQLDPQKNSAKRRRLYRTGQ